MQPALFKLNTPTKENTMNNNYFEISGSSPELKILNMISSTWVSQILQFALNKQILEFIHASPLDSNQLALKLDIDEPILIRILKGLEHLALIKRNGAHYELSDLGTLLLPNNDAGFYSMAKLWGEEFSNSWSKLSESSTEGKPGFEIFYGQNIFEYLQKNPLRGSHFGQAMNSLAKYLYQDISKYITLMPNETIVDVGGGNGFLIKNLLANQPHAQGILFDLPDVIANASEFSNESVDNLSFISGDFFEAVPQGDSYILANIIHDWSDVHAIQILKNIRSKQKPSDRLFLVEMALNHDCEPALAISTDLNMLMLTGGKERNLDEFKSILECSGYSFKSITNVLNMTCLIEAFAQ